MTLSGSLIPKIEWANRSTGQILSLRGPQIEPQKSQA
jgi:hypothetical protein